MTDHLLVSKENGIATLTMNRPKARNALSMDMRYAMFDAVDDIEHDESIRCVVLRGAGGHFMAGGDIKNFHQYMDSTPIERQRAFERRIHGLHPMIMSLQRMDKPVIASVQGAAAGAGMSFMMACDLAIAADDAFFKYSYVSIGASPDGSGSYTMPRLIGLRRSLELAILGDRIDAAKAEEIGLVNFVVPAADLEAETTKLAERLANAASKSIGSIKRLMYASHANSLETQLAREAIGFGHCAGTSDFLEGINSFLEKRPPQFNGK